MSLLRERSVAQLADENTSQSPLDRHFAEFERLVATAHAYAIDGHDQAAAVFAQIAAKYAASRHPGLFASSRLEHLLVEIGRRRAGRMVQVRMRPACDGNPKHVLHVFTQVAGIGGHTRMVWRWLQLDAERSHSLAITRQGSVKVPRQLREAVAAARGKIYTLDERPGDLLSWADELRRVAATADQVILHVNPDDVIPVIAFAEAAGCPPVTYLNHADQLFWLGASISNVVANLRESGAALSSERRGITTERSALLPIALGSIRRTHSRLEAKARLGIASDSVVALTIARPHKYASLDGVHFLDLVLPVFEANPRTRLVAIGPAPTGRWQRASELTDGRVMALGVREDTVLWYQAADVYLDSFPLVSITSLLEAGSYGLPLLSYSPYAEDAPVFGADTPGLNGGLLRVDTLDAYHSLLTRLIEDEDLRLEAGEYARKGIVATHGGTGWLGALEAAYRLAATTPRPTSLPDFVEQPHADAVDRLTALLFAGEPDLDTIVQFNMRLMPRDLRWRIWLENLRNRRSIHPGLLLPEWLAVRLEKWRYPSGSDRPSRLLRRW